MLATRNIPAMPIFAGAGLGTGVEGTVQRHIFLAR